MVRRHQPQPRSLTPATHPRDRPLSIRCRSAVVVVPLSLTIRAIDSSVIRAVILICEKIDNRERIARYIVAFIAP